MILQREGSLLSNGERHDCLRLRVARAKQAQKVPKASRDRTRGEIQATYNDRVVCWRGVLVVVVGVGD